jgi:hypothetical protein
MYVGRSKKYWNRFSSGGAHDYLALDVDISTPELQEKPGFILDFKSEFHHVFVKAKAEENVIIKSYS